MKIIVEDEAKAKRFSSHLASMWGGSGGDVIIYEGC